MNIYPLHYGISFYPLLISFHLQITYRKVRNLQIGIDKLVGKMLINWCLYEIFEQNMQTIYFSTLLKDKKQGHKRCIYLNGKGCPSIPFYVYKHVRLTLYICICGNCMSPGQLCVLLSQNEYCLVYM